jgi:hypothetical protein
VCVCVCASVLRDAWLFVHTQNGDCVTEGEPPEDRQDANYFLRIWIHMGKLGY